jgi:hypothetical protein
LQCVMEEAWLPRNLKLVYIWLLSKRDRHDMSSSPFSICY